MITIRNYESADINELAKLMGDLGYPTTPEEMERRMDLMKSNPYSNTFVAISDDKVVGMIGINCYLNYETDGLVTHILALVVSQDFQGRGIGQRLVGFIEEWAIANGSQTLYLTSGIKEERKLAHELYKKMGFDVTGYRFVKKVGV